MRLSISLRSLLGVVVSILMPVSGWATDPTLDPAFTTTISPGITPDSYPSFSGGTGAVNAVALQSDGKIIVGGNVSRYQAPPAGSAMTSLKRLNADGTFDSGFNAFASTLADTQGQTEVNKILVVGGDKMYVGGVFQSYQSTSRSGIMRLNADGSLDTGFDLGGVSNSVAFGVRFVLAIAEQTDGKVLVGGAFNRMTSGSVFSAANFFRVNSDGTRDTAFCNNVNASLVNSNAVQDIAVLPDGKILVAGAAYKPGGGNIPLLVRLNADGTLDTSFTANWALEYGDIDELLVLPDGRILIGGDFTFPGTTANLNFACLNASGSVNTAFMANVGSGPNGWTGGELALQPDGTILVGGIFNRWNNQPRASIARLNADGTLDAALAVPPYTLVQGQYLTHTYSFAVQPDGKLVIGGWFDHIIDTAVESYNLARITNEYAPGQPGTLRMVSATRLTAENAGTVELSVSRFTGLTGAVGVSYSITAGSAVEGTDYTAVSGTLNWADGDGSLKTITVPILQDAAQDGARTFTVTLSSPTGGAFLPGAGTSTLVTILDDDALPFITLNPQAVSLEQGASFTLRTAFDSVLSATVKWQIDTGSGFTDIPGATSTTYTVTNASAATHAGTYRAVVTNANGFTNSGTAVVSISIPAGSIVNAFAPGSGTPIVTTAHGVSIDSAGRYLMLSTTALRRLGTDGVLEPTTSFGINVSGGTSVLAMPDGRAIVAGNLSIPYTHLPSNTTSNLSTRIFRVNNDATGTIDSTWSVFVNGPVTALALGNSAKFYVGTSAAATSTNGIQRFNADGTTDATWVPTVNTIAAGTGATVVLIRELADGKVLISHRHGSTASGTYRLTRLNSNGTIDTTFGTNGNIDFGTSNWVNGLDVLPDGRLAVSARFNTDFFTPGQRYLAILNADGTRDTTFQFATGVLNGNPNGVIYRDGRLFVFGAFTTVNGNTQAGVMRVNLDGSIDSSFSAGTGIAGGAVSVNAARYTTSGEIFIAGGFTSYKGVARNSAALIVGNPQIGTLGFAPPRVTTLEEAATLTLTLKRYGDSTQAASIDWTTVDGTATAGVDYVAANGTATWAAGDSADKTITITKLNNAAIHANRVFTIALSNPSGPAGAGAPATVTLIDDDTPVTINTQPVASTALYESQALTLSVAATSPSALSYQWYLNGVAISGATSATYSVPAALLANGGVYHVRVTNASGTYLSTPSLVSVRPQPGRPAAGQATLGRPAFGSAPTGIVVGNDGHAYIGGSFTANAVANVPQSYLIRVKPDGSTDTSYTYAPGANITAMAKQSDGKILIAGSFTGRVRRLNADGTVDTAFTTALGSSIPAVQINDFAFDSLGRIYLGGASYLARLSSTGAIDSGYAPAVNNTVLALAVQPDDKLIVAGFFTSLAGSAASRLGRLNTDGTRDAAYTGSLGGTTTPNDLLVLADGRVLLAMGGTTTLIELSNTGSQISNIAGTDQVFQIAQAPGGKILATRTGTSGTGRVFRLLGTNPFPTPGSNDGDSTFSIGTGPDADARVLTVAPDGSVWIAGLFSSFNSVATSGVVRLNGDPLTPGIVTQPATTGVAPGDTAYLGVGTFGSGLTFQWFKNGSPLSDGGNVSGATTAVLTLSNATTADDADYTVQVTGATTLTSAVAHVYVLGAPVVHAPPVATTIYAGQNTSLSAQVYAQAPATYVWRRDGVIVTDGGRISGATTATLTFTGALATDTGSYTLTVTNGLGTATTTPVFQLVRPVPHERVPALGNLAASAQVMAFHALPDGRMLVAGISQMNFNGGAGSTSNNNTSLALVKPDGTYDTNPNVLANGSINALARQNDGKWLIGGNFISVNGIPRNRIARLNADFTLDATFDAGTGPNSQVSTFGIDSTTGKIYVGGMFTQWNGSSGAGRQNLARLNADGTLDTAFSLSVTQAVSRILTLPNGDFLFTGNNISVQRITAAGAVVGGFSGPFGVGLDLALTPDGTQFYVAWSGSPFLGRYSLSTGTQDSFNAALNNNVGNVAVQADGKIVLNGGFNLPNSSPLRLLPNGSVDPLFTRSNALMATVTALAIQPSGRIWLGGTFNQTYGPATATRLLVLNGDLPALAFEGHPVTAQVEGGQTATFTASVAAASPVTWQWFKGSTPLSNGGRVSGATSATLSIANVIPGDEGLYHVEATSTVSGTISSVDAELIYLGAPEVLTAPLGGVSEIGISRTLSVQARGAATLTYQWFKGTSSSAIADISGATSASYTLATPTLADTAYYGVRITNGLGMVTTTPVLVTFASYASSLAAVTLPAFGSQVNDVIPLADGFIAVGLFSNVTPVGGFSTTRRGLARFNSAGALDTNFPQGSAAGVAINDIVRDSLGRFIFIGNYVQLATTGGNVTRNSIARIDSAGALDTGFNSPLSAALTNLNVVTVDASDNVLVGGGFTNFAGATGANYLVRLNAADGTRDTGFTAAVSSNVNCVHVLSDGKLLVGTSSGIVRLNANGTADGTFAYSGGLVVTSIAPVPSSTDFIIGGSSGGMQRITANGTLVTPWPATGTAASSGVTELLAVNGGYFIGGSFLFYNSTTANYLTLLNSNGTLNTPFAAASASGFNSTVNSLAQDGLGRVWVGGAFSTYRGVNTSRVVVLNGVDNIPADPGAPVDNFVTFLNNAAVPVGQQGYLDDPDGDGLSNLLEYALDLSPMISSPQIQGVAAPPLFTYTYRRVRPEVTYVVEASYDLINWSPVGVDQGMPLPDGTTTASIPFSGPPRFLHLKVTR
ncbi:MAG: immunoglobulin domain-containing protein [Verrucomicrobiaceae bacterium]|nr:immunoglobulin domain-containing protein [Verrucomicrobiaceae bacterium]